LIRRSTKCHPDEQAMKMNLFAIARLAREPRRRQHDATTGRWPGLALPPPLARCVGPLCPARYPPQSVAAWLSREAWNKRMLGFQGPAQPSPTLGDALNAGLGGDYR
jgi:hypothetical protein